MKLNELKLNMRPMKKDPRGFGPRIKTATTIGSGIQTLVYAQKKIPNAVMKVIVVDHDQASAVQFLRICSNHPENPFFPKIYAYKMVKAKDLSEEDLEYLEDTGAILFSEDGGGQYLIVICEKLNPYFTLPVSTKSYMISQLGILDLLNETMSMYDIFLTTKGRETVRQTTTNPQFRNALRLLEPLFRIYQPDMHDGNFMVRGTNQLIINDPIAAWAYEEDF